MPAFEDLAIYHGSRGYSHDGSTILKKRKRNDVMDEPVQTHVKPQLLPNLRPMVIANYAVLELVIFAYGYAMNVNIQKEEILNEKYVPVAVSKQVQRVG
ncbi:MAG: hypothetical protein M1834_000005 [Cirrosporium novae-zelandiae]|nr:MAG: hypothetical protein M1834_000005 [Cirrosporium novae-zelandiae]